MDERTRALVELSAALASGSRGEWRGCMSRALDVASAQEVEETVLQCYLFLGYPVLLQALSVWREVHAGPPHTDGAPALAEWRKRGEKICRQVYGETYDKLRENMIGLHPDVEGWMLQEGYGKVLGRPGLDLKTRELCVIALLAAQDAGNQLYSHLRGALNTGATIGEVDDTIAVSCSA